MKVGVAVSSRSAQSAHATASGRNQRGIAGVQGTVYSKIISTPDQVLETNEEFQEPATDSWLVIFCSARPIDERVLGRYPSETLF